MSMTWLTGTGAHRKNHREQDAPVVLADENRVHAEPAFGDMTIDEIRGFCDEAEKATGPGLAGHLRPRVAVRASGAVKGIWVKIPR